MLDPHHGTVGSEITAADTSGHGNWNLQSRHLLTSFDSTAAPINALDRAQCFGSVREPNTRRELRSR
jgi:hypothetical protein